MVRVLVVCLVVMGCGSATRPRWETLPAIPAMPSSEAGDVEVGSARIHYAVHGQGTPVVLLHGGLSNGEHWVLQVRALARSHRVIVIDSRGHGRSTLGSDGLHYAQMAKDVVAVLDALKIDRASIVGWSDGAIVGLELAMQHGDRVNRVFAFGANGDTSGLVASGFEAPVVKQYIERASADTARVSGDPKRPDALGAALGALYEHEPAFTDAALATIRAPVAIVDGDHDEIISGAHTRALAKRIPGARLIMLRAASHLAPWQAPDDFNREMIAFLDEPSGSP
jgi:pimeloyl-ACP methyl ester carboxylesterase